MRVIQVFVWYVWVHVKAKQREQSGSHGCKRYIRPGILLNEFTGALIDWFFLIQKEKAVISSVFTKQGRFDKHGGSYRAYQCLSRHEPLRFLFVQCCLEFSE